MEAQFKDKDNNNYTYENITLDVDFTNSTVSCDNEHMTYSISGDT